MKALALFSLAFATSAAMALTPVEPSTEFSCVSQTNSGRIVTVSGCVDSVGRSLVACPGEDFEFLTITRETNVAKMTPDMVETVKIPGRLFDVQWIEELFEIELVAPNVGQFRLSYVGGENKDEPQSLTMKVGSFDHSFKAVGCQFSDAL